MTEAGGPLLCGVLHWPADVGPYLWAELDMARMRIDLARIRAAGFSAVRLPLAWDAFMPSDRRVSRPRLRDLEAVLVAAAEISLQVVPVLFAQSWGDCVWLPAYAVHRRRPRRGVRVISDGRVQEGGPRDLYDDPLMLEVAERWIDTLLRAFAGHPGVLAWDLGHDPATTVRPRRIAHLDAWVAMMAERVHAQGARCWMTLGAADLLVARAVRPARVARHVDALGLAVAAGRLPLGGVPQDATTLAGLAALAMRVATPLLGDPVRPLIVSAAVPAEDPAHPMAAPVPGGAPDERPLSPAEAVATTGDILEQVTAVGAAGLIATWSDTGERTWDAPPFDGAPWLARCGLAGVGGELKPHGRQWSALALREPAATRPAPWPARLDIEEYYANLPDSALELMQGWRGVAGHE